MMTVEPMTVTDLDTRVKVPVTDARGGRESVEDVTATQVPGGPTPASRNVLDIHEILEWHRRQAQETRRRRGLAHVARRDASTCARCGEAIGATVYICRTGLGNLLAPTCAGCAPSSLLSYPADACEACGRPVVRYRPLGYHVYCSQRCQRRAYRQAHKPEPEPTDCVACGERVDVRRADARYCSNACRQKAYRTRKAVAA
jgi:endogenous inhibitor of DNA gyrase (YacG/DUF329 family)